MIPEIITFHKTVACRLEEFSILLSDIESPCSDIKEIWSTIFHDLVIPKLGWHALWILSESSCIKYNLIHPTAVIVTVESYNWDDMTAIVRVRAVQDDIVIPAVLPVAVIELHPIKGQEYSQDDLRVIADWLDKCRYFFKYLWYPWDAKINISMREWCESHLENRLKIHSDIQNGVLDPHTAHYYISLLIECKQIDEELNKVQDKDLNEIQRRNMIDKCIQRKVLKTELNFLEEPCLRDDLMALRKRVKGDNGDPLKRKALVAWKGGEIDQLTRILSLSKSYVDSDTVIEIFTSFQGALDNSSANDMIILPMGVHMAKSLMGLKFGGSIIGLGCQSVTTILPDYTGLKKAILFECFGDLHIQNVTISKTEGTAVQASGKSLKISNCRFTAEKGLSSRGIVVLAGSTLVLENCEISGFGIGVTLQKGTNVSMRNTRIYDCIGGIKVGEESNLSLDVEIRGCSEYAIRLETSNMESQLPMSGDIDWLLGLGLKNFKLDFQSVKLEVNRKHDILIDKSLNKYVSDEFFVENDNTELSDESSSRSCDEE